MQTKKQSIIEVITNTGLGFVISLIATFAVFPILNIKSTAPKNIAITICFTVISLIRSYIVRRWFNKPKPTYLRHPDLTTVKRHCFECEMEMRVIKDADGEYCANCGLLH